MADNTIGKYLVPEDSYFLRKVMHGTAAYSQSPWKSVHKWGIAARAGAIAIPIFAFLNIPAYALRGVLRAATSFINGSIKKGFVNLAKDECKALQSLALVITSIAILILVIPFSIVCKGNHLLGLFAVETKEKSQPSQHFHKVKEEIENSKKLLKTTGAHHPIIQTLPSQTIDQIKSMHKELQQQNERGWPQPAARNAMQFQKSIDKDQERWQKVSEAEAKFHTQLQETQNTIKELEAEKEQLHLKLTQTKENLIQKEAQLREVQQKVQACHEQIETLKNNCNDPMNTPDTKQEVRTNTPNIEQEKLQRSESHTRPLPTPPVPPQHHPKPLNQRMTNKATQSLPIKSNQTESFSLMRSLEQFNHAVLKKVQPSDRAKKFIDSTFLSVFEVITARRPAFYHDSEKEEEEVWEC
jgi:predicted  nucleic acid-binding Zn-ribbon protein